MRNVLSAYLFFSSLAFFSSFIIFLLLSCFLHFRVSFSYLLLPSSPSLSASSFTYPPFLYLPLCFHPLTFSFTPSFSSPVFIFSLLPFFFLSLLILLPSPCSFSSPLTSFLSPSLSLPLFIPEQLIAIGEKEKLMNKARLIGQNKYPFCCSIKKV